MIEALILGVRTALDAGSTSSVSQITTVSGAGLLILAWAVCAILIVVGIFTKKNQIYSLGIVAAGVMAITTPLVYYVFETMRLGAFTASIQDFLLLASLSTLGGGIITIGILNSTQHSFSRPCGSH